MTKLSVNINKIATLRNSRGGDTPNLVKSAIDIQEFGAQGITVHPRPDERHIKYQDVRDLKPVVHTEFNIEGYPDERYMNLVLDVIPHQATLVPDPPEAITSNAGWDTVTHFDFLQETINGLKSQQIRTSIFIDPVSDRIEKAAEIGCDRIELYTENYARTYDQDPELAVKDYRSAAELAHRLGLEVNAGHDLDMHNLKFFKESVPYLAEVSIGHAIMCDALYLGLENTIQLYLRQLEENAVS